MMMTLTKPKTQPETAPAQEQHGPAIRTHDAWDVGDVAHQGDLTLVCIAKMPKSATPRKSRQVADGETQGSRHVVEGGSVFDADAAELAKAISAATGGKVRPESRYCGPVIEGPCVLTHPQHQHQRFGAGTTTAVVYQRNLDAEEREVRARD